MAYPVPPMAARWFEGQAPYPSKDDTAARWLATCLRVLRGKDDPWKSEGRKQYRAALDMSSIYHPRANIASHLVLAGNARRGEVGYPPNDRQVMRGHIDCARSCRLADRPAT